MQQLHSVRMLALFLIACVLPHQSIANESIKLQLKWSHQFQFAGYYAAQKQGYYKAAGLDVEIIEAKKGDNAIDIVLKGDAEYGVGNTSLLLYRNAGKPVVVLAVIFQHSADVLLSLQTNTTQSIHNLKNRNLKIEPISDELTAYLYHEGLPKNAFTFVSSNNNIEQLISGEIDIIFAHSTIEPYYLTKRNIPFNIYSPRSAGIDFYGDNLFTTESELKNNPERVRKFRQASLDGWRYAMTHQDEMIDYFLKKYPGNVERGALVYEANTMFELLHPELIDIGYMLPGRWRHIAETYASIGMMPPDFTLEGFLYTLKKPADNFWIFSSTIIFILALIVIAAIYSRYSSFNRKLLRLLHLKSKFSNIGESINNISHQWKQPLNELGIQLMIMEKKLDNDFPTEKDKIELKNSINKSHNILEFMADTVNVFGQLLNQRQKKSTFYPKTVIQSLLLLIEDNFKVHKVIISYQLDDDSSITGNPTELAHILLSILNNARDIFHERDISTPRIVIHLYKSANNVCIDISDNAGGITANPIDKIFKLGFSNKKFSESGIGLYIAKQLTEEEFKGEIKAENSVNGAVFKIIIPCSNKQV